MTLLVRTGWASRPKHGEIECGDQVSIRTTGDRTLIVVADGLGHGSEAAFAATAAVAAVQSSTAESMADLMRAAHASIAATRGVALTLVRIDAVRASLEHVGVGNVEMTGITRVPIRPVAVPGVVGSRIRKVLPTIHALHAGDLLVLHTDGVSSRFVLERFRLLEAQPLADALLAAHAKDHDDAACVVLRV